MCKVFPEASGGLPAGVLNAASRNCIPLIHSDILITSSVSPQSRKYCLNTVGAAGEKQVSSAASYTSREAGQSLTVFPCRKSHCWLVQHHDMPPWGRGGTGKVHLTPSFFSFSPKQC